jgi:hypothetical protein
MKIENTERKAFEMARSALEVGFSYSVADP